MSQDQEMKNSACESVFLDFRNCYSHEEAKLVKILLPGLIPQNIIESSLLFFWDSVSWFHYSQIIMSYGTIKRHVQK